LAVYSNKAGLPRGLSRHHHRLAQRRRCCGASPSHRRPRDIRTIGLFNGKRAVPILVSRQPGANIVDHGGRSRRNCPALQAAAADIHLSIASDRTLTIRASLHEVESHC
jgi:multidrug efflux pump